MFKAKEPESLLAEDRKREDLEFVSEMCEIMKTNPKSVKSITRLGKINREKYNSRANEKCLMMQNLKQYLWVT